MKRSDHLRQIINDMKQMDAIEFLLSKLKDAPNNEDFFAQMNN